MAKKRKRIKKVMVVESVTDYSFDQMREFLQDELNEQGIQIVDPDGDQINYPPMMPWIVDIYPDHLIYRAGSDLYSIDYTASDGTDGPEAEFGDPVEVYVTYTPTGETAEAIREAGKMFSAANVQTMQGALDKIHGAHKQVMAAHKSMTNMIGQMQESLREADKAPTASVDGEDHPAEDFAYVPHAHKPGTWKFPIFDKAHVDAATARLNQADIPAKALPDVKAKVRAAWKEQYADKKAADMPDVLKEGEDDESDGLTLLESGLIWDQVTSLSEAAIRPDGTMPIKIIDPGWGSTGYYSREMLERDADKFPAGTQMFLNHATKAERAQRPEGDVTKLAATLTSDARFLEHAPAGYKAQNDGPGIYADAKVVGSYQPLIEDLAPHIGISINGEATGFKYGTVDGRRGPIVEGIKKVDSVDFVTRAGRGGEVLQIMESYSKEFPKIENEVYSMNEDEIKQLQESQKELETENKRLSEALILREAGDIATEVLADPKYGKVPAMTKARIAETEAAKPPVTEDKIDVDAFKTQVAEAIKAEVDYLAKVTGAGNVTGMGSQSANLNGVTENADDAFKRREKMFRRMGLSESSAKIAATGRG